VAAIEIVPKLAAMARENLRAAGYGGNVTTIHGDGSLGCPEFAPYDAISVAAGASEIPAALLDQLTTPAAW